MSSRFVVSAADSSIVITADFKELLQEAIDDDAEEFDYTDADGNEAEYDIVYDPSTKVWSVKADDRDLRLRPLRQAPARSTGWAPTTNGMDMLTRLMYGGRVSLIIGFIVVVIEASWVS